MGGGESMNYQDFLERKAFAPIVSGLVDVPKLYESMFDHQRDFPALTHHSHVVEVDRPTDGMLFAMPAETLQERISARRDSIEERVIEAARLVAEEPSESWIICLQIHGRASIRQ
jgi:hypothetical protein